VLMGRIIAAAQRSGAPDGRAGLRGSSRTVSTPLSRELLGVKRPRDEGRENRADPRRNP